MSVTTTSNPVTYASAAVLRDYELTHSDEEALDTSLNAHPAPPSQANNPADWPTDHRRVPAYRPVNTELDQSERRVYQNPIERAFIGTMFTGVFLQSVSLSSYITIIVRKRDLLQREDEMNG
jgi:SRSO17 transposase